LQTRAAYEAYLTSFPKGVFAPLARAAIEKTSATGGASTKTETGTTTGDRPGSGLRTFSERSVGSGAITFNIGDEFNGPGVLTVGWAGSKKQLVLPAGKWFVLAAVDSKSEQPQMYSTIARENRVDLTTVVLGRFSGAQLKTLLRFTVSSKRATVQTWSDLSGCDDGGPLRLQYNRSGSWLERCAALRVATDPLAERSPALGETRRSLSRMNASAGGLGLVSTLSFSELKLGYLGVARIDWPDAGLGPFADKASSWSSDSLSASPQQEAFITALAGWSREYERVLVDGFKRNIDSTDLIAAAPARTSSSIALGDFMPPRAAANLSR
jgi:hypothetical protein